MAASKRKIGIYSIAGIAAAIVIIAAFLASGLQLPGQLGTLVVSIKDAPVDLEHLWVTINGLMVQSPDDSWLELTLNENPMTFDLLALTDGKSLELSNQALATGEYSKIRMEVETATATIDGVEQELTVPPGHIDIITKFQIEGGELTALMIDMQPDTTAISNSGNFKPVIKATVTPTIEPTPTPTGTGSPAP